jgi:hypothetical protein
MATGNKKMKPGPGRPPGSPNKISRTVKDNVIAVFDTLGGSEGMARWAQENQTEFYRLYSRLIPTETKVDGTLAATIQWPLPKPKVEG